MKKALVLLEGKGFYHKRSGTSDRLLATLIVKNNKNEQCELKFYSFADGHYVESCFGQNKLLIDHKQLEMVLLSYHNFLNLKVVSARDTRVCIKFAHGTFFTKNKKLLDFFKKPASHMILAVDLNERYADLFKLQVHDRFLQIKINKEKLLLIDEKSYTALVYPLRGERPFPLKEEFYR